ncbi:hypothetical protein AMTRI_Chr05g61660 [Amborella trichopoda]
MKVFLNFCDEDTGKSFTSHLNKALTDRGISTFFWSPTQQQPNVFSPNYASSFFCLDQLSYLLSLPKRLILPLFYDMQPAHVRRQEGAFRGSFFVAHRNIGIEEETMHKWRNSLNEVACISGWDTRNYRTEAHMVSKFVRHVSMELERKTPLHVATHLVGLDSRVDVATHLVGLDSRVDDVMRHLEIDANDVQMIGIHGMGGIGKTTLAKEVEFSKTKGVVKLQRQLLKELFDQVDPSIYNVDRGINVIKNKIGSKKVLIVFDDIDDDKQLEKLASNRDWYCQGSRIIITSWDEHVLNAHNRVDNNHIYKLKGLDQIQSLELFSWCAFHRNQPTQKYMQVSKDVISTTGGLPLALEVLGHYLRDKTTVDEVVEDDVMQKLKISYDNLSEEEKDIFLDIAYFFIHEKRDYMIDIWKGCGFPASLSMKKLLQRSFLKINNYDRLWMHDQLRDMGRRIVELENLDDHGEHSRLWFDTDVITVLKNHKGTRKVRGLMIRGNEQEKIWETEAFKPMINLKLLSISQACLRGSLKDMSSELVRLQLRDHQLQYLPKDCSHEKLVVLDLSNSDSVHDLPKNNIKAEFLTVLYMSLKRLILEGCKNLVEIPDSIGLLRNLVYLNLRGCPNLKKLPDMLGLLVNLEELDVSGGSWRVPPLVGTTSSEVGYEQLQELPENFGNLTSLRTLNLSYNSNLTKLPSTFSRLCSLEELFARDCSLQGVIDDDFEKLSKLKKLDLYGNKNIQGVPRSMKGLSQLKEINITYCTQLVTIPELPTSLECLEAGGCSKVQTMLELSPLSHLKILELASFEQLMTIPELPTSLKYLSASGCISLKTLPQLSHISELEELDISGCEQLLAIPELPTSLQVLKACGCHSLQTLPKLSHLLELRELGLNSRNHLIDIPELSTSLIYLNAFNWRSLQTLPKLSQLSKLEVLDISYCVKLLAIKDLPTTLKALRAPNCILLQGLIETQGLSGLKSLKQLHLNGCRPHALRDQRLAKETFAGLDRLSVPGSKVPNWFKSKWTMQDSGNPYWPSLSYRVSGAPDEGICVRGVMVCFVAHFSCTHNSHCMELLMKSEYGVDCNTEVFYIYPGSHQHDIYFYHLQRGQTLNLPSRLKNGDEVALVKRKFEGEIEADCNYLMEAGFHLVFESEDTDDSIPKDSEDSISEKLAFFNSLFVQ